jgi:hypothetical protein
VSPQQAANHETEAVAATRTRREGQSPVIRDAVFRRRWQGLASLATQPPAIAAGVAAGDCSSTAVNQLQA